MDNPLFSSIDFVHQCLIDSVRVEAFAKAISRVVSPETVVLDLGAGSGILSLLSAKSGAKRVYAVEADEYLVNVVRDIAAENDFGEIIQVIHGDARFMDYKDISGVGLVVAEMITTGLVEEHHLLSINNVFRQNILTKDAAIIPSRIETYVNLVEADFNFYGFRMNMVQHLWRQYGSKISGTHRLLSEPCLLNCISFASGQPVEFSERLEFVANIDGFLNSIMLSSRIWVNNDFFLDDTISLAAPIIFPLSSDQFQEVHKGEEIQLKVSYKLNAGFQAMKVDIIT